MAARHPLDAAWDLFHELAPRQLANLWVPDPEGHAAVVASVEAVLELAPGTLEADSVRHDLELAQGGAATEDRWRQMWRFGHRGHRGPVGGEWVTVMSAPSPVRRRVSSDA